MALPAERRFEGSYAFYSARSALTLPASRRLCDTVRRILRGCFGCCFVISDARERAAITASLARSSFASALYFLGGAVKSCARVNFFMTSPPEVN
jgi:hypothetical protein